MTGHVGMWGLGVPNPVSSKADLRKVEDTPADKFASLAGGKVKRAVKAEYAALQEHVKRLGGYDEVERVYAAPLDNDGVVLPHTMRVHNVEWVADGAVRFIQVCTHGAPCMQAATCT